MNEREVGGDKELFKALRITFQLLTKLLSINSIKNKDSCHH